MKVIAAAVLALAFATPALAAQPRISPAERAQINKSLDVLVNNGVKRVHTARSYDVVTQTLKTGMTRKQWAKGDIPIYPFPAIGHTFHQWNVKFRAPGEIAVELVLFPTLNNKEKYGPIAFDAYMKPVGKRWLVDGFMPMATFAPVNAKKTKVRSVADFSPQPAQVGAVARTSKISPNYLIFPFIAMGGAVLAFLGWFVVKSQRERRLMRAERHRELPPFPPRFSRGA